MVSLGSPRVLRFLTSDWTGKPDTNQSEGGGRVGVKAEVQISGAADDQQVQGVTGEGSEP